MKHPITTKDLMVLNELILFEQWASTKFRHYYDEIDDKHLSLIMKDACLSHADRHDRLFDYLDKNQDAKMEEDK